MCSWRRKTIHLVNAPYTLSVYQAVMETDFDPPLGQPNPPLTERASAPIGWILGVMLVVGVIGYVAHYLGWL
jgi:hypothetical protein